MFGIKVSLPMPRPPFLKLVDIKDTPAYSEAQHTFRRLPISLLSLRLAERFKAWHIVSDI